MDLFKIHFPKGYLANYVESIVYYEGYHPDHSIEKLLPDGTANLVLELKGQDQYIYDNTNHEVKKKYQKSWVSGMQFEPILISSSKRTAMMVIQFKPNGAYPIIGIPMHELNNQVIEGDLIFSRNINLLRDQLMHTNSVDEKILQAEDWLLQNLKPTDRIAEATVEYAIKKIMLNPSVTMMKQLAHKTGYSQQHFIHLFKKHVGLTPKQYQRVVRFNRVLGEIESTNNIDWHSLSNDLGYFDQAHFIKEFNYFSGFSPGKYMMERGEFINYVPMG